MTSEFEIRTLKIFSENDGFSLGEVAHGNNPVAIVDDELLDKLYVLSRAAKSQAKEAGKEHDVSAINELCTTLSTVLDEYSKIRNKLYQGIGRERQLEAAKRQIEEAFAVLDKLKGR